MRRPPGEERSSNSRTAARRAEQGRGVMLIWVDVAERRRSNKVSGYGLGVKWPTAA